MTSTFIDNTINVVFLFNWLFAFLVLVSTYVLIRIVISIMKEFKDQEQDD